MKRIILRSIVILSFIVFMGPGSFAFDKGLGDLGKPPDYEQTIKRFRQTMPDFDAFVDQQPAAFDWRDYGVVTPAGDQGSCGSCWSFTAVGAIESKILILGGPEYNFSEQQQVSCNTTKYGCCGGSSTALRFWYTIGPMEESCTGYGDYSTSCYCNPPFHCSNVPCSDLNSCSTLRFHTTGYYTVDTSDFQEVKASLYQDGPAYFRFDVYPDFYTFWDTGSPIDVYYNTGGSELGGHAILIIGWDDSKNAWLCKNSWGATTGPNGDGTFWIARSGHTNDLDFGMANVEIAPRIWYVDDAKAGDGTSWNTAFNSIQEGIDAAEINIDEVWVKEGIYELSDYIEVDRVVGIYGGFVGTGDERDWRKYVTTVDGEGKTQCFDVVANATIDGFTIKNGYGDYGGAMMIIPSDPPPAKVRPTVRNCRFIKNEATEAGGAIYTERAFAKITNCTFSKNKAGSSGGAIHNFESAPGPTFSNCIFYGNTSGGYGGAVSNYMSQATYFLNCTFSGNRAKYQGGALYNLWNGYYITNSILWGDSAGEGQEIYNYAASTTVRYSDIQGGYYGEGNIDENPKFENATKGDLHLKSNSPCIDSGTNDVPELPPLELKPTPELPDMDFEGDLRILDGDRDFLTVADMGADEYAPFTLWAPNGGWVIPSGSLYPIQWSAPARAVSFKLKYSVNNGKTWKPIASGITDTSYDWTVPTPSKNKTKCLVKVIGYDASRKKVGADSSDGTFTIEVLTLTSPNGGDILTSRDPHTITWTTRGTKKPVAKVMLLYTINGGKKWKKLPILDGNPGSYGWTVPDVPKTKSKCRVKVLLKDASGKMVASDMSDGFFTIKPAP